MVSLEKEDLFLNIVDQSELKMKVVELEQKLKNYKLENEAQQKLCEMKE